MSDDFSYIGEAMAAHLSAFVAESAIAPAPSTLDEKLDLIIDKLSQATAVSPSYYSAPAAQIKTVSRIKSTLPPVTFDAETGETLTDSSYIEQLIKYAITTAKNELIMRPVLGSWLHLSKGKALSETNLLQIYAAVADALKFIAHYFTLDNVSAAISDNNLILNIQGTDLDGKGIATGVAL